MNEQQLSMIGGIAEGIDKAANNLFAISMAKNKLKQDNEIFNLTKKQKELEIKKAEYTLDPEQLQLERNKLDAETKAQTALFNLRSLQMETEEKKQKKELEMNTVGMNMVKQFLEGKYKMPEGTGVRVGPYAIAGKKGKSGVDLSALLNEPQGAASGSGKSEVDEFLSQF